MVLPGSEKVARQRIELSFPERPVILEPAGGPPERGGHQAAKPDPSRLDGGDQPGALEDAEVLEEGGKRNVVRRREGGYRPLSLAEGAQHRAADRVGQGDEGVVEAPMVNHKDNYYAARAGRQGARRHRR